MSIRRLTLATLLSFLIIQLNIYFAWTSRVGVTKAFRKSTLVRLLIAGEVNEFTKIQLGIPGFSSYFMNLADSTRFFGSPYTLSMKYFIDYEVILFTLLVFIISLSIFKKEGIRISILRAIEITSATILPLGLEIYFSDRAQFYIHASDIQVRVGLAVFTNADVLYLSTSILVACLLIEIFRRVKTRNVGTRPNLPYSQENSYKTANSI